MNAIVSEKKIWDGKYLTTEYYLFKEADFQKILEIYEKELEEKREEFRSKHPLIQLQQILKYIFKRNSNAKENKLWFNKIRAYSDKTKFLQLALQTSRKIKSKYFSYGVQKDPNEPYYPYVYYFQIKSKQLSFHCEVSFESVPAFKKEWVGYRNEKYPFTMNLIKEVI